MKKLKGKTIFDFCDKVEVLQEITAFDNKEEYLELFGSNKQEIAVDLLELAEQTKDKALKSAVEYEYAKVLASYRKQFNE